MKHTEEQLREIASGRRLHQDTKIQIALAAALLTLQLIFFWWEDSLFFGFAAFFAVGAVLTQIRQRLNALSHFVCGDAKADGVLGPSNSN